MTYRQPLSPEPCRPSGPGPEPAVGVSAVVLAGGRSRRLGMDKALLQINGEWLLQRIVRDLRTLADQVLIVANDGDKLSALGVPIVPDLQSGQGVLGGIYSGLRSMQHHHGLFVGCDMPLLNLALLRYMISLAPCADVVIPRVADEVEPLHAIYSKACSGPIAQALQRGEFRPVTFFSGVRVRFVEQAELELFDPENRSFFNINTPQDLETAQALLHHPADPML